MAVSAATVQPVTTLPAALENKPQPIVVRLTVADPILPPELLASAAGLSRTTIKDAMVKGAVWLKRQGRKEQRLRKASFSLLPGDRIVFYYDPEILALDPVQPECVAMERQYSVWDKPAGLLSQGSRYGDHCSLLRFAEKTPGIAASARLVHRLDREARGLVLLAHGRQAAARLSAMFQTREIEKRYLAEIHGIFGQPGDTLVCDAPLDGKASRTTVTVLQVFAAKNTSRVEILLETGRYHQIRRHLSGIGHPLVGDRRYGNRKETATLRLTAFSLGFTYPFTGKKRCYVVNQDLSACCS